MNYFATLASRIWSNLLWCPRLFTELLMLIDFKSKSRIISSHSQTCIFLGISTWACLSIFLANLSQKWMMFSKANLNLPTLTPSLEKKVNSSSENTLRVAISNSIQESSESKSKRLKLHLSKQDLKIVKLKHFMRELSTPMENLTESAENKLKVLKLLKAYL